ncbi:MAG: Yip1 family protein [Burkholderiales bacterium]
MQPIAFPKMVYTDSAGWPDIMRVHPSLGKMFSFYVVPMSLLAAVMMYYAALTYSAEILPHLTRQDLQFIAAIFFLAEIGAVLMIALLIQRLGEVVEIRPSYQDAFILAAIAPTPLWLATLFFFIPSVGLNLAIGALAMMAAGGLIYNGVRPVFQLDDDGKSLLLAGSIFAAGLVAWVVLMVLTLLVWGYR